MVVLLIAVAVAGYGFYSNNNTKVDTIPYLTENQVIIFTEGGGQNSANYGRPKKPVKILLKIRWRKWVQRREKE